MRGSPACVFLCVFFGTFFFLFFYDAFSISAVVRQPGRGMSSVCAFCMSGGHMMGCLSWALWLFEVNDTNSVMTLLCCVCVRFRRFGWLGVGTVAVCLLKRVGRKAFRWMVSLESSLGGQDEAYLEHQQIFCSRRFLFLMTYKTHLILYYFTKSVRKIIKVKTSCCHCFKLLFSSRKDLVKSSIMTPFSALRD
ncbi:hypothetical protein BDC45DRAFT_538385 [Circinella umbellata]|nr:hypothetical protein BDC45DRAFT_538385 [Circinella umbellata]